MDDDLLARARDWIAGDPDPDTAAALQAIVDDGDPEVLASHVGADLSFGTAGLRGAVGPGPNRMNRAVVVRATRGVADHLLARVPGAAGRGVAVGFDARPDSGRFADDVVAVLRAAGIRVLAFTTPTATPLVAFAARHHDTAAAIVVTASHNPPADNGYKVYDEHGVQITPPTDLQIAEAITAVGPARGVPGVAPPDEPPDQPTDQPPDQPTDQPSDGPSRGGEGGDADLTVLGDDEFAAYRDAIARDWPGRVSPSSPVRLVVTPLHGVGGAPVERLLVDHGHDVVRVDDQWAPDGSFPTVDFPNPEEPGALDLAMARADEVGATAILATDPDTDRLAVALPGHGGWERLSGDEVGCLFADHLLAGRAAHLARPLVANSIVSSARLGRIAAAFDTRHEVTLTGFKWLWRAGRHLTAQGWDWVLGYEEALGYSLGEAVRDKDGINAAVVMADLVAGLAADGRTLQDRRVELDERHGRWANVQESVRRTGPEGAEEILAAVDVAAGMRPGELGSRRVERVVDHRVADDEAPPWRPTTPLVVWHLVGGGRILVRPSGTEPKLKVYVDLPLDDGEDHAGAADLARVAVDRLGITD